MPTYDYVCQKCEHAFEHFQSMSSKPLTRCPKCAGRVRRLIGAGSGIIFKGSGFYHTDYRKDSYRNKEKAESSPSVSCKNSPTGKCPSGGCTAAA